MSKNPHDKFIQEFQEKQPVLFDSIEILDKYINNKIPIKIKNKYGECLTNPYNLLEGKNPCIKSALNKNEYFKNMLIEKNPNYFNLFTIIGNYESMSSLILIKTKYGFCKIKASSLLANHNPRIESAVNKTEYFINQAKEVHGDLYDYSLVNYVHSKVKVKIISKHGIFEQPPAAHLQGAGCLILGRLIISKHRQENPTGWSYTNWEKAGNKSKNFDSFKLYVIQCQDSNKELFYKIGKTFLTMEERFCNKLRMPYNYLEIKIIEGDARYISELETELKNKHKQYKYLPKKKFGGMYECFSNIDIDLINKCLNNDL